MGFFAVFKKNKETGKFELVDRWLNNRDDKGWIERTITSMGWSPADVVVAWYWAHVTLVIGGADDDLKLFSYKKVKLPGPNDTEVDGFEVDESFDPIIWYKNGELVKQYE